MKSGRILTLLLAALFAVAMGVRARAQEAPADGGAPAAAAPTADSATASQPAPDAGEPIDISVPPPGIPIVTSAPKPAADVAAPAQDPAPVQAAEPERAPEPETNRPRILILPVRVTAYQGKDKFYGESTELSQALQQFLSYSIAALSSDAQVVRTPPEKLYERYPVADIYTSVQASLADAVDRELLRRAANVEEADIIVAAEVSRAAVLVEDLRWTMDVEVRLLAWNTKEKTIISEQTLTNREIYNYADKKQKDAAGNGSILTFSGRKTTASQIAENPVLFGGTINGYPFVSIARRFAAQF